MRDTPIARQIREQMEQLAKEVAEEASRMPPECDEVIIQLTSVPSENCIEWPFGRAGTGYGQVYRKGTQVRAHRLSYMLNVGLIPDGLFVCHHCDNPPCINPRHLFLGTASDNMQDSIRKGRNRWGRNRKK